MSCLSSASLYADDQVIHAPSARGLQETVNKMNDSVKKRGTKVNVGKTKFMVFERGESTTKCNVHIDGEKVEQVKEFVYLDTLFTNGGKHDRDIKRRVNAGNKCNRCVVCVRSLGNIDMVTVILENSVIWKEDVVTRVKRGMLRWFDHLEMMNERRLMIQIYRANGCDEKVSKDRPRKFYADRIGGILKMGQILNTRNRRACKIRFMDVSEEREI
ncbi:hypothetical protein EVAR_12611_1 [Eumeta japonica]|uniref:Reverse transcriptase domain-containing protein n=1 Tax=Eumeta variegata TaxID=151549 RepID=A0A4C1UG97_EUMVA|nr:hypothetical protein EVAR_12611_1 [Eumeta japonica]